MARPEIDEKWKDRIKDLAANEDLNPTQIARRLDTREERDGIGRTDSPARTTVQRVLEHFPEAERILYRSVRWPESFGTPDLPWQSARDVLSEVAESHKDGRRITVRWAIWFWRLRQSMPSTPEALVEARLRATELATFEALSALTPEYMSWLNGWLEYHGWTAQGRTAWNDAVRRRLVADGTGQRIPADTAPAKVAEAPPPGLPTPAARAANALFAAHAREDVPYLLARLSRLEAAAREALTMLEAVHANLASEPDHPYHGKALPPDHPIVALRAALKVDPE